MDQIEAFNSASLKALNQAAAPLRFERDPQVTVVATYSFTVDDTPTSKDVEALSRGLTAHALPYTQVAGFQPIGVFMRDEHGALVGGVWGYVNWNWLWIGAVWLSDAVRGAGYGRQMMEALEHAARERGCRYSHLDTFSFQARPFYEGLGYESWRTALRLHGSDGPS